MMENRKIYRLTQWTASLIIAAVLLSGYHKVLYPADFAVSVYRFHLLPGCMVNAAALYLPWLELVCAAAILLIPCCRVAALWIILVLLLLFTLAIGINLWRGSAFGCGCFGRSVSDQPLNWISLARNAGLIALVSMALISQAKQREGVRA